MSESIHKATISGQSVWYRYHLTPTDRKLIAAALRYTPSQMADQVLRLSRRGRNTIHYADPRTLVITSVESTWSGPTRQTKEVWLYNPLTGDR